MGLKYIGDELPAAVRVNPEYDAIITDLEANPGIWALIPVNDKKDVNRIAAGLRKRGAKVATRKSGEELYALWLQE